jgi:heme-degrading monooxygenase HmoA
MTSLIDLDKDPDVHIRLDSYCVPAEARAEFEAGVQRSVALLETLPGFRAHLALAKESGGSAFNIVTIAVWQSREAMANAVSRVQAHYQRLGYDPRESAARLGITADVGNSYVPMEVDPAAIR